MKWGFVALLVLVAVACSPEPVEPTVEPPDTSTITDVVFAVTSQDTAEGQLIAMGTVRNTGSVPIAVPWFVSADFYADNTYLIRLGGNATQILTPLEQNQTTFWTIEFSSPNVDVRNYPTFYVTNLRAYYPTP